MQTMFLLCLLTFLSLSNQMNVNSIIKDPHAFTTLVDSIEPDEVRTTRAEIRALIDMEEEKRTVAQNAVNEKTTARDAVKQDFDAATNELAVTSGELRTAQDNVEDLKTQIANQKNLISSKTQAVQTATTKAANLKVEYDNVKESVRKEKSVLDTVKDLLKKLQNGDAGKDLISQVETNTQGLKSLSRTSKLLTNPSFLSALAKADPAEVLKVIDLVNKLISAGAQSESDALQKLTDAQNAQSTAEQELQTCKDDLTALEKQLEAEEQKVADLEKEKASKTAIQESLQKDLDKAQEELNAKQAILDSENERINGEQEPLKKGENNLSILAEVLDVLSE